MLREYVFSLLHGRGASTHAELKKTKQSEDETKKEDASTC